MTTNIVCSELNLPPKYTKPSSRDDRIEAIVNRNWLRQIIRNRRIPDFIFHDKYSDDEVSTLFKQGESFSSVWEPITITVIKKEDKLVISLPRVRSGIKTESKLSISQILHYVTHSNQKNLWKEAFRKFNHGTLNKEPFEEGSIQLTEHSSLIREVIGRLYGLPVIKLGEPVTQEPNFQPHPNLLPAIAAIESSQYFLILQESKVEHTLQDCVTFSPSVLSGNHSRPMFIIYQLLRLMRHLHDIGLVLGDLTLHDIKLGDDLWIQVIPRIVDNVYDPPTDCLNTPERLSTSELQSSANLGQLTEAWVHGCISNYDYLCFLNKLAGRRLGDPRRHYVLPWVSDLTSRSGSNWRDFTKSKFRLNKGDRQLDLTYQLPASASPAQVPHHVPDVLSEITYYVYLSRVIPKTVLCKYVRSQWVPAEYPASIQRLCQWTPDECIPEFFSDPSVFKSIHSDLGDLEVPPWASSPQDFISHHRAALESSQVSEKLHHWIDLTFGYKLSGVAAVKAKNVCLQLVDGHTTLTGSGVVQLFTHPHPHRVPPSPYWGLSPPSLHSHDSKKALEDEDNGHIDGHSSGLEEEEPPRSSSGGFSRFQSRSRTSLITSPVGGNGDPEIGPKLITLPRGYNPVVELCAIEALHGFVGAALHSPAMSPSLPREIPFYKKLSAARKAREMQVLGCLIIEMLLSSRMRVFGSGCGPVEFSKRIWVASSLVRKEPELIPRCFKQLVQLLLLVSKEGDEEVVTDYGIPQPSAHQLLQPLLTSSLIPFPQTFPSLYSTLVVLLGFTKELSDLQVSSEDSGENGDRLTSLSRKISELKVKSIVQSVEAISDGSNEACLWLLLPYIKQLLNCPQTDVIAAWYLFDHVSRGLGPVETTRQLLDSVLKLYDWERPQDPHLLRKRIKLYHRSFLLRLIVRFGLSTFLESFIPPLVEAVGGYHDFEQPATPHLDDVEEGIEVDGSTPLSPLDEDSSADSERTQSQIEVEKEPEVFILEEDSSEENVKQGPKSAISLQNLLIDNLDSQSVEEKEADDSGEKSVSENSDGAWPVKTETRFGSLKQYEQETLEYSKTVYVGEVCEVGSESVMWLATRLGPVLTARYLSRNLLRMLSLSYAGVDNLKALSDRPAHYRLRGDDNAQSVIHCLASIAALYGEQLIVVQYLPHMADLITLSKKKLTTNLEGGLIGCLALLSHILDYISDITFVEILLDTIVRNVVSPSLRLLASSSTPFPSGVIGRCALAFKVLEVLGSLVRRAAPPQRKALLHTLQRFFLVFSKAHSQGLDSAKDFESSGSNFRERLKKEMSESPPLSTTSCESDSLRLQAIEELREALNAEFAYLSYIPFANFFGETMMEQSLKNFDFIKELCSEFISGREAAGHQIPGTCDIEPPEIVEPAFEESHRIGSFSNVIVVGNRIDLQEPISKSCSPTNLEDAGSTKRSANSRHLKGNWLAYWEHEIGRSSKDPRLNVKQIKLQSFVGHSGSVRHIVPLASENSFMSAGRDKTVRLWSLRSQGDGTHMSSPQWTYTGHKKSVVALGFVDRLRLSVSCDSVVQLWDPFVGRVVSSIEPGRAPPVNALRALSSPSATVLCATAESTIRSLDCRTCTFVNELKGSVAPSGLIRCLVVSPNSNWLAVGHATGVLTLLDLKMGTVIASWKAHDGEILQLVPIDEHSIMSTSLDQVIAVWSTVDGKLKFTLKGTSEPAHCLDIYGNEVISGTTANRIGVHTSISSDASFSSTRLRSDTLKGVLTSMSILPLNRLLLLGSDSGNISLIC